MNNEGHVELLELCSLTLHGYYIVVSLKVNKEINLSANIPLAQYVLKESIRSLFANCGQVSQQETKNMTFILLTGIEVPLQTG